MLRFSGKPHTNMITWLSAAFLFFALPCLALADAELMIGVNDSAYESVAGVTSSYAITDIISSPSDITVFVSGDKLSDTSVKLLAAGEKASRVAINGRSPDRIQEAGVAQAVDALPQPYYIWDLGSLSEPGWKYLFNYNGQDYYARTLSVDGAFDKCELRAFIDNDNDYYYSSNDVLSGIIGRAGKTEGELANPFARLVITEQGQAIFTKAHDNDDGEIVINSAGPYLLVDGVQIQPMADDHHDVLISTCGGAQTWTLLKEYTPWVDVNILGYYTDPGVGNNRGTIFHGPDSEGFTITTSLPGGNPLGLWLLNDTNGDTIFNGTDSWLFSERYLTRNSLSNEHQWFMVYDVSGYKGSNSTYQFVSPAEDFATSGDYDYLVYIDDDHTSANWDHNDMILGITCNNPPVASCPGDTTIFACDLGEICIPGFECSDPDNNLESCETSFGTLNGGSVCFTPTGPGTYTIVLTATDSFGLTDNCQTNVTVQMNTPPTATCPGNQSRFVCDPDEEICIPGFSYSDPDNNVTSVQVIGCELHQDTVCFIPEGSSKTITYIVTDACGAADTCVTQVNFSYNQPPAVDCPNDTSIFVCDYSEICIPGFVYSDPDNNIADVQIIGCEIHEDTVCFVPDAPAKTITLIVTDECGETATCSMNIDITLNSPPQVSCPSNDEMFVCSLNEICLDGFGISDVDNNITDVTVTGGTLNGSQVCFTPVEGLNTITITATDACGQTAQCSTDINVSLNSAPVVECPGDTTIFACDLSDICLPGFSVSDADDNIQTVNVTGGTLNSNEVCFTPVVGTNTITVNAIDACEASAQCQTHVEVVLNSPPVAECPGDTNIFTCDLSEICLPGFNYSDPNNNITSTTVSLGTLDGNMVCFTPVEGLNTITLTVTDDCNETDQCVTHVTVNLNNPPAAYGPFDDRIIPGADTSIFMCEPGEICLTGFYCTDPDDNLASCEAIGGVLNDQTICFTPVEGNNVIMLIATDECGSADTNIVTVEVWFNSEPEISCPNDTTIFMCESGQICLPGFTAYDVDDNIVSETVSLGTLNDGIVCFTPVPGVNTITHTVIDECGASAQCVTNVTVGINNPPQVSCPNDTTISLCELEQICIDGFSGSDPDNNITSMTVSIGTLNGSEVCFTPAVGLNTIVFTVTDACGEIAECSTNITINLNTPPSVTCPGDTSLFLCTGGEVCLNGFSVTDPDDNIASIDLSVGTLNGSQVCFTPVEGLNTITLTVTDDCGGTAQCVTNVTASFNNPPQVSCPGDVEMAVCDLSEICIDGFSYSDPDDNITGVTVSTGTLANGEVCFTPVEGLNTITLTVTDGCGVTAECHTDVTISLNSAPAASCPSDLSMLVCDLSEICLSGFTFTDADDNIQSIDIDGGTLDGNQVCFTPVEGVNTITATVTDDCGASDQCITEITVTLNSPPVISCPNDTAIQVGELTEICIPGFDYSDPDDNIQSVTVDNGTINGDEVCFTPVQGNNQIHVTVTDECGETAECDMNISVLQNVCPVFTTPADTTYICTYEDFCDTVEAFDENGDYIEITATYGELTPLIDEPGHWKGMYCFNVEEYDCGLHNNYEVIIQADDGLCVDNVDVVYNVTVLGYVDMFLDQDVNLMPGETGQVGLYFNSYDCMCVGGLTASVDWDASVLTLLGITPTANLDFGQDYFNVSYNAFGQGTAKITYIAELDCSGHGPLCDIDPTQPIAYLQFQVAPGTYPADFTVPICFVNEDIITDNGVSDSSGYHVWWHGGCGDQPDSSLFGTWMLNLECGSIRILNDCDLMVGDINLNRRPFEAGDVVLLANHLMDPSQYGFNIIQMFASDVNGDSIRASIGDLIYMINVLNGINPVAKIVPQSTPVNLVLADQGDGTSKLRLESQYDVGGLVFELPLPEGARAITVNPDLNMNVEIREFPDRIRVVVYSMSSNYIPSGTTELAEVTAPEGLAVSLTEISASDSWGNLALANVTREAPLPEQFGISSCYPNPFNPTTTVEFTMPKADRVNLSIYDVSGRLVCELVDGYAEAGYHQVTWNGKNDSGDRIASGVYFARLKADSNDWNISVEKLVLLK